MNRLMEEADQVTKPSLHQLITSEISFRLVTGTFYIRSVNQLLRSSLCMAGYSYLTIGNMGVFLLHPTTTIYALAVAVPGIVLVVVEIGGLITTYQSAAYPMRVDSVYVLKGVLDRIWDACKGRNQKLLSPALADYLMMDSCLLLRIFTRIKPLDFVMYEALHVPTVRLELVLLTAALVLIRVPTMLASFVCMIEQKQFGDDFKRSMELLEGRSFRAVALLVMANLGSAVKLVLVYVVIVAISAMIVTLFVDGHAAMIVLSAVCARLELVTLFTGGVLVPLADSGALTVIYYQYGMKSAHGAPWDFTIPYELRLKRRWILTITGALAGTSLFLILDMMYSGISPDWGTLGQIEVTAHRGSPWMALENTVAVIEMAMEEMADYSEIDVQTTADGIVMVCHDLNLKRVTGVDRRLGTMTYDQISRLDTGSHFSLELIGERISTLGEVLEACKGRMKLNIELKSIRSDSNLPEQVTALAREYRIEEQCVTTSVKLGYLEWVKEMAPELRIGYIPVVTYGMYCDNECTSFASIHPNFAGRRLVEAAHGKGKTVHVWTVNSKTEVEQMKLLGVDSIITNYPVRVREVLYREETTETPIEYLKMMLR